jgi:iron(III) transport system substrate-binding protein
MEEVMNFDMFAGRAKAAAMGVALALGAASSAAGAAEITVYSGRGESFVAPIVAQFERQSGIKVNVRYGETAALAVLLQEEGAQSPADIYWAQDAGALGATAEAGLFAELPSDIYDDLPGIFRSSTNQWVATSGRSRVIAYSTDRVSEDELPNSLLDLTDERYKGRVAWAPTNGGFQSHVTAMRVVLGEERTREWLEGMRDNDTKVYRNNTTQVQAVGDGEVDFGTVNNYYLARFKARDAEYPVAQTTFEPGDIGNLVNVAGVGVLASSGDQEPALQFVRFLLSPAMQQFVTSELSEYPVTADVIANPSLPPFDAMIEASPDVDLDALKDLDGTLNLLREVGLL